MPHFSADLLDADPAELEAMRALLGGAPGRCTGCRPSLLVLDRSATTAPMSKARPRRQASEGRAAKRRPGPVSGTRGRTTLRPPMPG